MGKSKKLRAKRADPMSHQQTTGLTEDIAASDQVKDSERPEKVRLRREEDQYVDQKLTKKIIKEALKQQQDLESDVGLVDSRRNTKKIPKLANNTGSDSEDDDWPTLQESAQHNYVEDEIQIDESDEAALKQFMNPNPATKRTLADIIMEKINEKKSEVETLLPGADSFMSDLDPRIVEVYQDVRTILSKYRSGRLPKAFKVIPNLKNWEQILAVTEPESWSAAAIYQATRIFASNLNSAMAQRFFNLVLLPRVRDDIEYYKRLNFHLFMALKKAMYKPAGFFKGIILPLCEDGTCTLREATIISSVVANSIFLRVLIMKKYALPFRVIDALVFHFVQFKNDKRQLPVLWHQSLLAFVEIYRNDISDEQAESLQELLRYQTHPKITPEIRQQIMTRESKEVVMEEPL